MDFDTVWNSQLAEVRKSFVAHGGTLTEEALLAICQVVYKAASQHAYTRVNSALFDQIAASAAPVKGS